MNERDRKLRAAAEFIDMRLIQIAEYFTEPVKLTLIVRNPAHPDGSRDVHMGDDDIDSATEAWRRLLATGEETKR